MKIEKIFFENGSELVEVITKRNGKKVKFSLPVAKLKPAPSKVNPIVSIEIDKDLGSEGISYILRNGEPGTVHIDAFREFSRDPDFFRDLTVYKSTLLLEQINEQSPISKKELAGKLTTSVAHIYRIFESSYYGKTIDQIIKALAVYGYKVELTLNKLTEEAEKVSTAVVDLDKYRFVDEQKKQAFNPKPFRNLNYRTAEHGPVQTL